MAIIGVVAFGAWVVQRQRALEAANQELQRTIEALQKREGQPPQTSNQASEQASEWASPTRQPTATQRGATATPAIAREGQKAIPLPYEDEEREEDGDDDDDDEDDEHHQDEEYAETSSYVSQDIAINEAINYLGNPGEVEEIELEDEHGMIVYEITFVSGSKIFVDATSGQVVYASMSRVDRHTREQVVPPQPAPVPTQIHRGNGPGDGSGGGHGQGPRDGSGNSNGPGGGR
jgi:uncharacterized membrane protein YkoI